MPYGTSGAAGAGGATAAALAGSAAPTTLLQPTATAAAPALTGAPSLLPTGTALGGSADQQLITDVVQIISTILELAMGQSTDLASSPAALAASTTLATPAAASTTGTVVQTPAGPATIPPVGQDPLSLMLAAGGGGGAIPLATGGAAAATGKVLANSDPTRTTIAQIDTFTPDNTGFNHGEEVGQAILANDPNAATTDLIQLDIGNGDAGAAIADNLQQVLTRMDQGQDYDAINISVGTDPNDPSNARIQALINEFTARGVAVNIAAGNNGPGDANGFNTPGAFVVQNTQNGQLSAASGPGNILSEGRTTSFATAAFTGQAAAAVNAGFSLDQIGNNGVASGTPAAALTAAPIAAAPLLTAPPIGASLGGASALTADQRLAARTTADANATALIQNALGLPPTLGVPPLTTPSVATPAAATAAPAADTGIMSMIMPIIQLIEMVLQLI